MNPILDALIQQANSETSQETSSKQSHPQSQQPTSVQHGIWYYLFEQSKANTAKAQQPLTIGQMLTQVTLEDEEQSK